MTSFYQTNQFREENSLSIISCMHHFLTQYGIGPKPFFRTNPNPYLELIPTLFSTGSDFNFVLSLALTID